MEVVEAVAIIILILAIVVLIYYYLLNNPAAAQKIRNAVPNGIDAPMEKVLYNNSGSNDDVDERDDESMSEKIKIKLSDIDFNTDGFSKKIDAFLDEKSDQLIKDWSLATTDNLDEKFDEAMKSVDELEERFSQYESKTEARFESIEKRIDALEED